MALLSGNYKVAANSLVGGNVVAVMLRQAIRANAMWQNKARKLQLRNIQVEPVRNPMPFVVGVPVSTRLQETYTYQADATYHAVESGVLYTDHIIIHPLRVDLSFEVSNWEDGHGEYALELLEGVFKNRIPVELVTEHKKIPNMVMVSLQADTSLPEWGKIAFRACFQQISLVTIESVKYPASKVTPTENTGGPAVDKSVTAPVNSGQQTPRTSVVKKSVDNIKKLFNEVPQVPQLLKSH